MIFVLVFHEEIFTLPYIQAQDAVNEQSRLSITLTSDLLTQTETRNSRGACLKHSTRKTVCHSPEGARRQTTRG